MAGLARELCLEDTWSRPTNNVYQIRLHLPTTPNLPHPFHPPSLLRACTMTIESLMFFTDSWLLLFFNSRSAAVTALILNLIISHSIHSFKSTADQTLHFYLQTNLIDWGIDKQMEVNFPGLAQLLALFVEIKDWTIRSAKMKPKDYFHCRHSQIGNHPSVKSDKLHG